MKKKKEKVIFPCCLESCQTFDWLQINWPYKRRGSHIDGEEPKLMELIVDIVFAFCRDSSESDSYHGQAGVGSLHALQARHRKRRLSGSHQ